jgi:hypothetical protein
MCGIACLFLPARDLILTATALFAFLAAAAALISAWMFSSQLDEMRADKRAWVEIVSIVPSYLIINETTLAINVVPRLRNLGHTPAIDVATSPKFVPMEGLQALRRLQKEQCNISRQSTARRIETDVFSKRTIFPSDIPVSAGGYAAGIGIDTIIRERMREFHLISKEPRGRVAILGCVDYESMGIHRQTGFIVSCGMRSQSSENPDAIGPFNLANVGTIPNDQWHCVFEPGGTFAE